MEDLLSLKSEVNDAKRKYMLLKAELDVTKQKCTQFDEDNKELRTETKEVTEAIIRIELNEDSFKGDDEKVRLYTGLTN